MSTPTPWLRSLIEAARGISVAAGAVLLLRTALAPPAVDAPLLISPLTPQAPLAAPREQRIPVAADASAEAVQRYLHALERSGLADTLGAILGAPILLDALDDPAAVAGALEHGRHLAGRADPLRDVIELNPRGTTHGANRGTLAHETAHLIQARVGARLALHPPPTTALRGSYAATDAREQDAEAFAAAVLWLGATRRYEDGTSPATAAALGAILVGSETVAPGTVQWVRWLLTHPLYAEHPLRNGHWQVQASLALTPTAPPWGWDELVRRADLAADRRLEQSTVLAESGGGLRGAVRRWLSSTPTPARAERRAVEDLPR